MKKFITVVAIALCASCIINTPETVEAGLGQTVCPISPCGDVTHDGDVTATDALAVLRKAVGLDQDGNPNQPELCFQTQVSKRGTKVRTRLLGDVDETSECFTGKPFERVNP